MRWITAAPLLALVIVACQNDPEDEAASNDEALVPKSLVCKSGSDTFTITPTPTFLVDGKLTTPSGTTAFTCNEVQGVALPPVGDAGMGADAAFHADGAALFDSGAKKEAGADASADSAPLGSDGGAFDAGKSGDGGNGSDGGFAGTPVLRCTERPQNVHAGSYLAIVRAVGPNAYVAELTLGDAGAPKSFSCSNPVVDGGLADAAPLLTFDAAGPILKKACNNCHSNVFTSVDKVRKLRHQMISAIGGGFMPRGNSNWRNTPDGALVLEWLKDGEEWQ